MNEHIPYLNSEVERLNALLIALNEQMNQTDCDERLKELEEQFDLVFETREQLLDDLEEI